MGFLINRYLSCILTDTCKHVINSFFVSYAFGLYFIFRTND
jgi:hypothetical protein